MRPIKSVDIFFNDGEQARFIVGTIYNNEEILSIHASTASGVAKVAINTVKNRYEYVGVPFMTKQ